MAAKMAAISQKTSILIIETRVSSDTHFFLANYMVCIKNNGGFCLIRISIINITADSKRLSLN